MGFSRKRLDKNGRPRYTAYYDDIRGDRKSAGTYPSKKKADKAWQKAEARSESGKSVDPRKGRQKFRRYAEDKWLPNHVMEHSTRQVYTYLLHRHLMPYFKKFRMKDILPLHYREFVAHLQRQGTNPPTIEKCKVILDALFSAAVQDEVVGFHPGHGVKIPRSKRKAKQIITVSQYEAIHAKLGAELWQMLAEVDIETGLRWGELTELRPRDFDFENNMLVVSRTVVQLNPKFHPHGLRFLVKDYPKDGEPRDVKISPRLSARIRSFITTNNIDLDGLLFEMPLQDKPPSQEPAVSPDASTLGKTKPNAKGRTYQHGTLTAYNLGGCRCEHCRGAITRYRAGRRSGGQDSPRRGRTLDTDGHIPAEWFRRKIWRPAVREAVPGRRVTPRHLRDAHASWALHGGADIHSVRIRLGHGSIRTTELYLGRLPGRENVVVEALEQMRGAAVVDPVEPIVSPEDLAAIREEIKRELLTNLQGALGLST